MRTILTMPLFVALLMPSLGLSQAAPEKAADKPTLYTVGTAHLDTQWRWTVKETIEDFLPATLKENFKLFEEFPDYVFSFEGSFRYELIKEYYPEQYEKLKQYIDAGRWHVAGSWVDAVDVNMPACESLVRQTLYGNGYFEKEFGKTSRDVFLPDCFGFGYAMPSIAAHCGLGSFSTQKLSWGSATPVPFDIGLWEGVDGSSLITALRPGAYVTKIKGDLSRDTTWLAATAREDSVGGLAAAYMYFGTGDTGGGPDSASVAWLEKSMASDGPLAVRNIGSDEIIDVVKAHPEAHLPRYKGELLMTSHAVGCYTSEAAMKRWNRKNELLADAAERAAVMADLVGGMDYPRQTLRDTWVRFLWHQFHDDLTGTSIPEAYQYSWNDEILSQNRFAGVLTGATAATAAALDTRAEGTPLVVFNPLGVNRQDVVEATLIYPEGSPQMVRVYGPNGSEAPSQVVAAYPDSLHILILADVPALSYSTYDVRPAGSPSTMSTGLSCTESTLSNDRYDIRLDQYGDVVSIYDKDLQREMLKSPISLQLLHDKPKQWPAWEIGYDDITSEPTSIHDPNTTMRVIENGPVRCAIECVRHYNNSTFRTVIRLAVGKAGNRLEFVNDVDWYEKETLLKVAFNTTAANEEATYDIGLGTIDRGIDKPNLYEVPGQQWADLSNNDGSFGVSVLNDCKYGWDHPDSSTLRLTLIHTPGVYDNWNWVGDQSSMDEGHHQFNFAFYGHSGDWRDGGSVWRAARFNQPLVAFQTSPHDGALGKELTLFKVKSQSEDANPQVMINAVKLAENSDEIIVRVRELHGKSAENVRLSCALPILAAREVNGVEKPVGEAKIERGDLVFDIGPYQLKSFALKVGTPSATAEKPQFVSVPLPYNLDGISTDADRTDGDIDGSGYTLVGELLPRQVSYQGVPFSTGSSQPSAMNLLTCSGQSLDLPAGKSRTLNLLLTSVDGPTEATFTIGLLDTTFGVQDYAEPLGQWSNRLVGGAFVETKGLISPSYILREPVAWVGTHRHTPDGKNETYQYTYLYAAKLRVPDDAKSVQLPNNSQLRIAAATVATDDFPQTRPAHALFDVANATVVDVAAARNYFIDSMKVSLSCAQPGAAIRYTTDGSTPTAESQLYTGPFILASTTTLQARGLMANADDSYVTKSTFSKLVPHAPYMAEVAKPGLNCAYYLGTWDNLPDFTQLPVDTLAEVGTVALPEFVRPEDYGLVFTGYVKIPVAGLYDFTINSDDGSALLVCDSLIADNDGIHGPQDVTGAIALAPGFQKIKVLMFQKKGGKYLDLSIEGPGMEKQSIPAEMFFHTPK